MLWKVFPITSYPIAEINQNSIRIVNQHKGAFPNERLIKQVSRDKVWWAMVLFIHSSSALFTHIFKTHWDFILNYHFLSHLPKKIQTFLTETTITSRSRYWGSLHMGSSEHSLLDLRTGEESPRPWLPTAMLLGMYHSVECACILVSDYVTSFSGF